MRCANVELSFLIILLSIVLFSTIETRSLRSRLGSKAAREKSSEKLHIDVGLLEEKLESENLSAKTSLAGMMVGLVGEELEGVVQAWENLLPNILACYASLSGGE